MTDKKPIENMLKPFAPNEINTLPKPYKAENPKGRCVECGGWHGLPAAHLDYVGHAALTKRLLETDLDWSWEPVAFDELGLPRLDKNGGLWIRLTVCGVTRLGYGDAGGKVGGNAIKELIGDALRNAGMRFGAALDLWHKGDLFEVAEAVGTADEPAFGDGKPKPKPALKKAEPALKILEEDLLFAASTAFDNIETMDNEAELKAWYDKVPQHLLKVEIDLAGTTIAKGTTARLAELRKGNSIV